MTQEAQDGYWRWFKWEILSSMFQVWFFSDKKRFQKQNGFFCNAYGDLTIALGDFVNESMSIAESEATEMDRVSNRIGIRETSFWVNEITSSRHERTLEIMVRIRGIIPFYGRKIQVSELICPDHYGYSTIEMGDVMWATNIWIHEWQPILLIYF